MPGRIGSKSLWRTTGKSRIGSRRASLYSDAMFPAKRSAGVAVPSKLMAIVGLSLLVFRDSGHGAEPVPVDPALQNIDHAGIIREWTDDVRIKGAELYNSICLTCHGNLTQAGSLPTSRAFWREPFKNGADPYSLYRTLSLGLGQMPAWTFLSPEQRYAVIHFIREEFLKPHNPVAYTPMTDAYLASLPKGAGRGELTEEMRSFQQGPPYLRMDFGPALFWTMQADTNNIAYKGITIRLDDGPGGVSKGRAWLLYDHDTLRVAAGWVGDRFVDWRGIAFDGSHGTHTSIVGDRAFVNPVGPGWANPRTGRFDDPRMLGRDDKPYGPLPREWAHYRGAYFSSNQVVIAYSVGDAQILELPGLHERDGLTAFTRTLNIGRSSRDLALRIAPTNTAVTVAGVSSRRIQPENGIYTLRLTAADTPIKLKLFVTRPPTNAAPAQLASLFRSAGAPEDLAPLTRGGLPRWNPPIATRGKLGSEDGPFAVDELVPPSAAQMPWRSWMRFGGFDFYADARRAAICTWNGDVWIVSGIDGDLQQLVWKRIASGLFQPLGVKIVDEVIHVTCRDQIARLHDLNGDGEIDFIENFNNDHQVTEHFHEFAMGLQTDREGNFYYAKSARHALPAVVPHHGTLLKVTKDGSRTEIVANGFRAANGVCINDDGTFFVTDQEGHWTPKNRINWIRPGGFYGNLFGYHERAGSSDADMEPPLVWITNEMDRSPGELVRVPGDSWGPFKGSLLSLSYGTGRIYIVPHELRRGRMQGGVSPLPGIEFPTGVMRGRFHPRTGDLFACGLYAWAGNRQGDGGFYRLRYTGRPAYVPLAIHAQAGELHLTFSEPLDAAAAQDPANYTVKVWSLQRSANYGSKHLDEHALVLARARLGGDGRTVVLELPELGPTWGMSVECRLKGRDGQPFTRVIHNTIHQLGDGEKGAEQN